MAISFLPSHNEEIKKAKEIKEFLLSLKELLFEKYQELKRKPLTLDGINEDERLNARKILPDLKYFGESLNEYFKEPEAGKKVKLEVSLKIFLETVENVLSKIYTEQGKEAVLSLLRELLVAFDEFISAVERYLKGESVNLQVEIKGAEFVRWLNYGEIPSPKSRQEKNGLSKWLCFLLGVWLGTSLND